MVMFFFKDAGEWLATGGYFMVFCLPSNRQKDCEPAISVTLW